LFLTAAVANKIKNTLVRLHVAVTKCGIMSPATSLFLEQALQQSWAQPTTMAGKRFLDFVDRPMAMIAVADVWAAKENRDMRNAELRCKAPTGWTEGKADSAWKLSCDEECNFVGGGHHGPALAARMHCEAKCLVNLFMFFFPLQLLQTIAEETRRCAATRIGHVLSQEFFG
jgi:hypothetical protein